MAQPAQERSCEQRGIAAARRLPDALSLLRALCGPWFAVELAASRATAGGPVRASAAPLAIAALACLTDFLDGRIARRLGGGSRHGAALDVGADAAFLLCALGALAAQGAVSSALPGAAAISLLALWASRAGRPAVPAVPAPRRRGAADRFGHLAGIANFAVVLAAGAAHAGLAPGGWLWPASVAVAGLNLAPVAIRRRSR